MREDSLWFWAISYPYDYDHHVFTRAFWMDCGGNRHIKPLDPHYCEMFDRLVQAIKPVTETSQSPHS